MKENDRGTSDVKDGRPYPGVDACDPPAVVERLERVPIPGPTRETGHPPIVHQTVRDTEEDAGRFLDPSQPLATHQPKRE
jgi:hypothetical protein